MAHTIAAQREPSQSADALAADSLERTDQNLGTKSLNNGTNSLPTSSAADHKPASKLAGLGKLGPRVLVFAKPHLGILVVGMLALTFGTAINLLFPYVIRASLNSEFGVMIERDLGWLTLGLIALFAFQSVFFFIRHYCFQLVGYRVVTEMREALFGAILRQDIAFFDRSRVGDVISRLSSDTEQVQRALTINISVALRYLIQVLGGTVLMLVISVKLTLVILVLVPLLALGSSYWGKKLRTLSKRMQAELGESSVCAEEAISSIRTVRVFAGTTYEANRFAASVRKALETGKQRTLVAAWFSSSMVFFMHSAIACVVWIGGRMVTDGELSIGDLTGFLLYCVIVAVSFGFLVGTWVEFLQAVGASERIFEIIDSESTLVSPAIPTPIVSAGVNRAGAVAFENVSFSYPSRPEATVLKSVSFEIPEGKTVAVVGPSGAGKSTIAGLITRFYDPTQGTVRYHGKPISELNLEELRAEISVVQQNPQVFSIGVGENIRYGRISATQSEIVAAAKAANIHDFIESLPQGYDTLVGDKGVQLSGGERQRVAIARALLKNPKFLILDEATSALDSTNEKLVQEALIRLMHGRTCLVIAHRLSTVQHADQVLVLNEGEICQVGSHQELLSMPGLYRTLVEHQVLT